MRFGHGRCVGSMGCTGGRIVFSGFSGIHEQFGFCKGVVQVAFYILHFQDCTFGAWDDHDELACAYTGFSVYLAVGFPDHPFSAVSLYSTSDFL